MHLFGPPQANIIALPRTAFDDDLVYVVDDESRLRSRKVVRGDSIGERIIVEDGINGGDRVIVRPPIPAIEGMKVKLQ